MRNKFSEDDIIIILQFALENRDRYLVCLITVYVVYTGTSGLRCLISAGTGRRSSLKTGPAWPGSGF